MIDLHTHVVPDGLDNFRTSDDSRWPIFTMKTGGKEADVLINGGLFRRVARSSWDLEHRLSELEKIGVTRHVASPMPELFCHWSPPSEAAQYCRNMNRWLGTWCRASQGAVEGLGILPLQDPDRSLEVLGEIRACGLIGVEIATHVTGVTIGDHRFHPVFAAAARENLLVFIHAFHPRCLDALTGQRRAAVGLPIEVNLALSSLLGADLIGKLPGLQLLSSHGGGSFLASVSRLQYHYEVDEDVRASLSSSPWEAAKRIYYDSMTFDAESLQYLVKRIGGDRIVIGSDFPFAPRPAGWNLSEADLSEKDCQRLVTDNAVALLASVM